MKNENIHIIKKKSSAKYLVLTVFLFLVINCQSVYCQQQRQKDYIPENHSSRLKTNYENDYLVYHKIETDHQGKIIPWFSPEPDVAYNHTLNLLWNFWDSIRTDMNGLPYYMNHQVWLPNYNDGRGIGGDQIAQSMSSWYLLYLYSGNPKVKENMRFMADYYLSHSLSDAGCVWADLPYPYNTVIYSGIYDGDMILGKGYTQPDKAGSFGYELVNLYKVTNKSYYLDAAIKIANSLSKNIKKGDQNNSPMPFKVFAKTGEIGKLKGEFDEKGKPILSSYSTNYAGTLNLFLELIKLNPQNSKQYQKSFQTILAWMKNYPMKTNKWGPFFEDIPGWSDTQINAVTWAQFIMEHQDLFPDWKNEVKQIFNWVYKALGNKMWEKFGVTVINEQTKYPFEGQSHTARQASIELLYSNLTADTSYIEGAIRKLNWTTYMVDFDGKNQYPICEIWFSDGYVDFIRHLLRAMAYYNKLAPPENHILSSTTTICHVEYAPNINKELYHIVPNRYKNTAKMVYLTYDSASTEVIRVSEKPKRIIIFPQELTENEIASGLFNAYVPPVSANPIELKENDTDNGFHWQQMEKGGIISIYHKKGNLFIIE